MADEYILKETVLNYLKHHSAFKSKSEIMQDIAECEPADVVPVRHARWRHYEGMYACEACGAQLDDESPFCPNCGARMYKE